jgi:hypothetical protein
MSRNEEKQFVIGFKVTREERDEFAAIAKQMAKTKLPHPHFPGHSMQFLPSNRATVGELVKFATRQYVGYFKELRDNAPTVEALPQASAAQLTDTQMQNVKAFMQTRQAMTARAGGV